LDIINGCIKKPIKRPYTLFYVTATIIPIFFSLLRSPCFRAPYFEWFSIRIYDWKPLMTCTGWTRKFISGKQRIGCIIRIPVTMVSIFILFFYFLLKGTTKILTEKFTRLQFNPSLNIYQLSYRTILLLQITRNAL